jgi:Lhr-like helicase
MGREVRRVPKEWQHPKDERGKFIPLHGGSVSTEQRRWDEERIKWGEGFRRCYQEGVPWAAKEAHHDCSFEEWTGERPEAEDYMPDWAEGERTHWQMYEDTTEGTPISPVFATAEELAQWLADTGASAFADMTATYEQWLATCLDGWAPSAVYSPETGVTSGVAGLSDLDAQKPN